MYCSLNLLGKIYSVTLRASKSRGMSDGRGSMGPMYRSDSPILLPAQPLREPSLLTDGQRAVVEQVAADGPALCVVGGPASGKTTALVATVVAQVKSGIPLSKLVILTGSRAQAQQLRARIIAALGTTQRGLQITTVHGWCLQLLQRFSDPGLGMPRLLSAPEQEYRVRELLAGRDQTAWPPALIPALGTRGFARQIRAILARARQLGFGPGDLALAGQQAGRPEWVAAAGFFEEYLDVLDAEGVIDYTELVFRARLLLADPDLAAKLPHSATMIICDEFAELDRGMIHLLADANRAGTRVIAFADPDTVISQFRGADPRAVTDFAQRFDLPGAPATLIQLDETPATDPQIVQSLNAVAARLPVHGLAHRQDLSVNQAGAVRVEIVPDSGAEAARIAEILREAHLRGGAEWQQLAVICPAGADAVSALAGRLSAAGIPVQIAGDELALGNEPPVRQLLAVLQSTALLADTGQLQPPTAERLLRTPLGGLDALGLRRLARQLRLRASLADPDAFLPASGSLIAAELVAPELIDDDKRADSTELDALISMRRLLTELAGLIKEDADIPALLWKAWSATSWPRRLQVEAVRGTESSVRAHRDLDAVVALFDLAGRQTGQHGSAGVRALLAEVQAQQIAADTARESDPRRDSVAIVTPYRAKGRQWDLVVLTGLQEGRWPRISEPGGLLRADLLGPDGFQPPETPAERMAAERRSFLLAASRARERLVAVAIADPGGEIEEPSRFISELGVDVVERRPESLPTTLEGLIALLRRRATDSSLSPALRQAAATELAWLADQRDDRGRALAPGADPHQWWGLRGITDTGRGPSVDKEPIRLSGSKVEAILACPRKWFLEGPAKGNAPKSVAMVLGTLVHELVAESALTRTPAETYSRRLAEIWSQLPYEAAWYAQAQYEQAVEALRNYDIWASSSDHAALVGVELPFQLNLELAGRTVVVDGTVDRLEVDSLNRLRVIDFKTDKQARSDAEVLEMDQLGIYQLAVREGAFDEATGGVRELGGAQVVYLKVPRRDGPAVRSQPPLEPSGPTWVHEHLTRAAEIIATQDYYANVQPRCRSCEFRLGCPAQSAGGEQE